jgi:(p)ppGpp synthase/HD superfamily hydrolase
MAEVAWAAGDAPVEASVEVDAGDRVGLLADLTAAIAGAGGNITSAEIKTRGDGKVRDVFVVAVRGGEHLGRVLDALRAVRDVERVRRAHT